MLWWTMWIAGVTVAMALALVDERDFPVMQRIRRDRRDRDGILRQRQLGWVTFVVFVVVTSPALLFAIRETSGILGR